MHNQTWRDLIALVPQKQHNKLVVMTGVGVEITVQDLIRVQEDYLVIRGRLAGTSDAGRLFFVPYDQITYVGILKMVLDHEIAEMFGAPGQPPPGATAAPAEAAAAPTPDQPAAEQPEPEPEDENELPAEPPPRTPGTPVKFPNRAELLERIKNRSQMGQTLRPPPK